MIESNGYSRSPHRQDAVPSGRLFGSPTASMASSTYFQRDQQLPLPLPPYIRPLPAHIQAEDVEYLVKKGALTLPDEDLQCALLRAYIQYVAAFMPLLDLAPFYTAIALRGEGAQPVSLILVQAVMFAGVAYVDLEYLTSRGFTSRKSARKVFFDRVRLLYGLECETDRMSLLQALLLMTYWYEKPEDEKETWYWLGIALSLAQVLGLHRNPDNLEISPAAKQLRKRAWWCCFMRDRLLALGLRRPIRLRAEDFTVPMLTVSDFESIPFGDDVVRWLGPMAVMDDNVTKRTLSCACIELAKLCVHIGGILSTQYSILDNQNAMGEKGLALMVVPKKAAETAHDITQWEVVLTDWLRNLDPTCRYPGAQVSFTNERYVSKRLLHLHLAMLHMIYFTTMTVLYRPRAFQSGIASSDEGTTQTIIEKVADAAMRITEIVHHLSTCNLLRFASTSSITAILSATLIHLVRLRSSQEDIRSLSIGRFYQCWYALQQLRDMYASADHAVWFLEAVIQKSNVQIPMLYIAPRPSEQPPNHLPMKAVSTQRQALNADGSTIIVDRQTTSLTGLAIPGQSGFADPSIDMMRNNPDGRAADDVVQRFPSITGPSPTRSAHSPYPSQPDFINTAGQKDEAWYNFGVEENFMLALLQFDANPNSFTAADVGQQFYTCEVKT